MLKKLWEDIQTIHDGFNFSEIIEDLMIISRDNYYLLHYEPDNKDCFRIRIEKDYNLVRLWSGDIPYDSTNYKIYVELVELNQPFTQFYTSENSMIELTYKIITPFLREIKLKEIGV